VKRWPWWTLAVCAGALAAWFWPALGMAWVYDRAAIGDGQFWRLATGHLVHFSAPHLAANLIVLLPAGWLLERVAHGKGWVFYASAMPLIGVLLWVFEPRLVEFGGLSGLGFALLTLLALQGLAAGGRLRAFGALLLAGLLAKLAAELGWGWSAGILAADTGVIAAPVSHAAGVAAAVMVHGLAWLKRPLAAAILVVLSLAASSARAEPVRMEITPFAGYRIAGDLDINAAAEDANSGNTEDGSSWGIGVGLYRDPEGFYELLYSRRDAGLDTSDTVLQRTDVRIEYLHLGGTLLLPQPAGYTGYISVTIGLTRLDADSGDFDSENKFSASFGGGFRFPLTDTLHATLGARGYMTLVDSDTGLVCVSDGGEAGCLLRSSGSTFWEAEFTAGLAFRF
jgi:rhomboid family GlyGly-CTERM serine protease